MNSATESNIYSGDSEENKNDQIILNISYDTETGQLILSDNYNNHYICDLFGRIKTKFLPNVTGQANHTERHHFYSARNLNNIDPKNNKNIKKIKTQELLNRPQTAKASILIKKGPIDYHPITTKFEGYSKFPRPLSPAFHNVPDYELKEQIKNELIQYLEKFFSEKNTKNIIINKNLSQGLSYLTSNLNEVDCMKVDVQRIMSLIKYTLDNIRQKYIFKINLYHKDPLVKALTQFNKFLAANRDTTIINNRKLQEPNSKIKKKYKYIQSAISRHGLGKGNNIKNINYLNKLTLNTEGNNHKNKIKKESIRNLTLESFKNKNNSKVKNKNDIINNILKGKNNDFKLGRKIKMEFGLFSYEEENRKKQVNITLPQENNTIKSKNKIKGKKETKETKEIKKEKEEIICNKKERNKTLDIKLTEKNISFISNMSENEKKYEKENIRHVKELILMKNNYNKEKRRLKGFKTGERKGFIYLFKNIRPKFKNNGELYENDMKLLRYTNPIAFKLQEKKDEFNMKQLIKKVNTQRINADNIMKGKKLKIQRHIETD